MEELRLPILFSGGTLNALVGSGVVAVCCQYFKYHFDRSSGDAYHTGIAVFNYNLTGIVVMVFFAVFLLPLYIKSGIFTIPEFLEKRFDRRSRYYFSAICIIGNIFLDAAGALYAAALIIKLILPDADLQLIIIVFAIIAASYTIPGGLSSAINAELIQAVFLY